MRCIQALLFPWFQYFQYFWNIFQYFQYIFCTLFVLSEHLWFSIVFSHWNAYNQEPPPPKKKSNNNNNNKTKKQTKNKTKNKKNEKRGRIFILFKCFWIICFWLFPFKIWFQHLSKYCRKSWMTHYKKKLQLQVPLNIFSGQTTIFEIYFSNLHFFLLRK